MIVAIIPARAGSKGCPGKNFDPVDCPDGDRPPIWMVQAYAARGLVDRIVLSTDADDPQAPEWVQVLRRDPHEAGDGLSTKSVVDHAVANLDLGTADSIVVLLPTFPRRKYSDVDTALSMHRALNSSIIGVTVQREHPFLSYSITEMGQLKPVCNPDVNRYYRRQDYPHMVRLTLFHCVIAGKDFGSINAQCFCDDSKPLWVDADKTFDIDTPRDLDEAKCWLNLEGMP